MIYYSINTMQHSQSIIGMASNEYELASPVLTLKIEDAKKLIAKWVDRYHLLDTPQQTYRRRLNGEPVFSLSVYFYFNMKGADEDQKWQAFTTFEESCTQLAKVQLFCRSNDVFLYDDESNKVLDIKDKKDIPKINRKIEKLIPSSEKFDFLGNLEIINRHYELVRITKPKKSIKELKAQAWEQTKHADYDLMGNFQQEFSLLQQRLDAGLPETMLKEHDAKTRAEAYLFPQEFAALRPLLADYLSTVFARSNFETEFSPRGIYFASGTQEGMPFDRVMGELNRALSLPEGGEADNWDSVSKEAPIPGAKGQSFFIKNLLQNVIFQEAGIAGENRWWELRNRAVIWSGYAALLALLVILGGLWLTSYAKNKAYLEEVDAKVPLLDQQSKALQNQTQRQGQYILQELRSRRLHPAEILESSNIRAAAALAANGYGIGFLSGELLEHLNNAVPFNAFPLRDCTLPLESVAAWRAGNYLPRYALAFIERMEQQENQKYNNSATKVH